MTDIVILRPCSLNLQICCSSLCLDISISNYRFMHERNENTKCCSDVSDEKTPSTFSTTALGDKIIRWYKKEKVITGIGASNSPHIYF